MADRAEDEREESQKGMRGGKRKVSYLGRDREDSTTDEERGTRSRPQLRLYSQKKKI